MMSRDLAAGEVGVRSGSWRWRHEKPASAAPAACAATTSGRL